LPKKRPNPGQPCGRKKVNNKPAQNKETTTKCGNPDKCSRMAAGHDIHALKDDTYLPKDPG